MEDVYQLQQIFPSLDKKYLAAILAANSMSIDLAIEAILSIEASNDVPPSSSTSSSSAPMSFQQEASIQTQRLSGSDQPRVLESGVDDFDDSEYYRGLRCKLPNDFLRPPGWGAKYRGDRDEQLALMLQNEMYLTEIAANGGARVARGGRYYRDGASNAGRGGGSRPQPRPQPPADEPLPDLGIVKTLNSVGKGFSALASRLGSSISAGPSGPAASDRPARRSSETEMLTADGHSETNPLVSRQNEDTEDEVISFDDTASRRNRHVLESSGDSYRRNSGSFHKKDK